jgi:hypothetical protein
MLCRNSPGGCRQEFTPEASVLDVINNLPCRCDVRAIGNCHESELLSPQAESTADPGIARDILVNHLNFFNFQGRSVIVNLRHKDFGRALCLNATPLPCSGNRLQCFWADPEELPEDLAFFETETIVVPLGRDSLCIPGTDAVCDLEGISLDLPAFCSKIGIRRLERYRCPDIHVSMIQNSALFQGRLIDFNALSFCVRISLTPPQSYQWLNAELPVNILLQDDRQTIFCGECRIIREGGSKQNREFVLCPTVQNTRRFRAKKARSTRQELLPLPSMVFTHPLTRKLINLKVTDISGSGLAVEEDRENPVLLPGMFLKNVRLRFTNHFEMAFDGQIIHRTPSVDDDQASRCGIVFLDMAVNDHVQLLGLLQHACDPNAYICDAVDMDELWRFFFDTGFIYPQKYQHLQKNKDRAKQVYQTLYAQNPNIARHFIYREKGAILGHISTLRFYDKAWLIHHHAAKGNKGRKAGIAVLNQIGSFINDSHSIYSMHMEYVLCYFRPENKFPRRVFGGVTESLNDPQNCSIDNFAYFYDATGDPQDWDVSGSWELKKASAEDLLDFAAFYENCSGGLLTSALDMEADALEQKELNREYKKLGIQKEREIFAFKENGKLKSILVLSISDLAINLSELTNCLKIFVLDQNLPVKSLNCAINLISAKSPHTNIPKLLFPVEYAEANLINYEKQYCLWIFKTKNSDQGLRQMRSTTRFNRQ